MAGRQVAITNVVSGVLWATGGAAVLIGMLTRVYGVPAIGIMLSMAAAVLNVQRFVAHCEERMRNAFQCGRDYERSQAGEPVRSLR